MKIGVVVHGPQMLDSGYAEKIMDILGRYGEVKARLGGTMGRTAVIDAQLETKIDISQKLLPSQSIQRFLDESVDVIFLLDYGKSSVTGHAFGYKVSKRAKSQDSNADIPIIQIERPGEPDGSVVPWDPELSDLALEIANVLGLKTVTPESIILKMKDKTRCTLKTHEKNTEVRRRVAGVSPDENIFINGMVVGRSKSSEITLVAENGVLTCIIGGEVKEHGVEKLGKIDLEGAIVKTGLLRRSRVKPRVLKSDKTMPKLIVTYLDHAAEDVYSLKDSDLVVTVGDDTTLVAADILYRFNIPIVGITDGDLDKVVEQGFKTLGSMVVELESGWDDIVGKKIFSKLFNSQKTIEIDDIENFKGKIMEIVKDTTSSYEIL
jgi:hypothetical protein